MQDMASSSTDPWILSLNMDDYQGECAESACVMRIPPYIRNLKPDKYSPDVLPMGLYNRDFTKKTPMDQLKLEIAGAFLKHLQIDNNQWNEFCQELASARGQVAGPDAPGLEHFYEDDGRPSFLTPELELSVLVIDAFYVVFLLLMTIKEAIPNLDEDDAHADPPVLLESIEIIASKGMVALMEISIHDALWVYENQVPLFLVENVWGKVADASRGFSDVLTRGLTWLAKGSSFPCEGDVNVEHSTCQHLLACFHRLVCTGTHPLMDNNSETRRLIEDDTRTGRFKSYIRKVPGVMQFVNFTEEMVATVGKVKLRYLTKKRSSPLSRTLPSAACLRKAGIRFTGVEANLGQIRFVKSYFGLTATLYLPKMGFHDFSEKMLLNLCAYENRSCYELNFDTTVIRSVCFMDELIDSEEDVELLMRGKEPVIIYNALGDNKQLVNVFTNILENYAISDGEPFSSIRTEILTWYNVQWRRQLIGFLDRFAIAPWLLVSLLVATVLLVLTLLQTIYTIWGFYAA